MKKVASISLILSPILFVMISIMVGSYKMDPILVGRSLFKLLNNNITVSDPQAFELIKYVRLPRIFAAILVGSGLALSGCVFQAIFRNPLSSPYTLGVSNGAGFGAALAILFSFPSLLIQLNSIFFSMLSLAITFLFSRGNKSSNTTILLSGMLVGSFFSSLISLIKFVADPYEKLPQIVFWLMGSISSVDIKKILMIIPIYLLCLVLLFFYRWKINVISLDENMARSFGVDTKKDKLIIILLASSIASVVVSISGIIGWIGIVVPHFARMMVGSDFRKLLPASLSLGITYMLLIDMIARSVSSSEIPIGVITGIIGVPLFLYFIYRKKVSF